MSKLKQIGLIQLVPSFFVVLVSQEVSGQTVNAQLPPDQVIRVEDFIDKTVEDLKIPGVSVAIAQKGKVVYAKGFGFATSDQLPVSVDTAFNIGSVSKSFAAIAIGQLSQAGSLTLDDKIVDHLPWFKTSDKALSDRITIRNLLSHTSGLSTLTGNINQHDRDRGSAALEKAVRNLASQSLVAEPGGRYIYSNANYQILGALVESITGQTYEDVIDQKIFRPLEMENSFVIRTNSNAVRIADGFRYWFGNPFEYHGQIGRGLAAQQGIYSTALDLTAYLQEFLRDTPKTVSAEFRSEMLHPAVEYLDDEFYGLGWQISNAGERRIIYHHGAGQGFSSIAGIVPDVELTFVVLVNANWSFGSRNIGAFTSGVRDILVDHDMKPVKASAAHRLLRSLVIFLPLVLVFAVISFFRRAATGKMAPLHRPLKFRDVMTRLAFPSFLLIALSSILMRLPYEFGGTLATTAVYSPDLAVMIVISTVITMIWAIGRPIFRLRVKAKST